ncbi:hypothetical protein HanIR_Chr09g0403741 [Helianthus annuus]|nr:hypothetical protein HanIR_Chr09g0403741 [Helianthus annuus]
MSFCCGCGGLRRRLLRGTPAATMRDRFAEIWESEGERIGEFGEVRKRMDTGFGDDDDDDDILILNNIFFKLVVVGTWEFFKPIENLC